ncbi:glycoside hydrolase family 30 protein [Anaerocolumna xylanovorans]|uniref:Glucosylceramidase n=1 Tax=Anaerocolumna xylanovorans DSM 12503 TaxID=1121345 RepID=A0A1M7Y519_9FIRM|nr:glycoside hydrolase family 30 beta sandwich domain-containing protein [Anaerocolumna xylanovorans]SHO47488.1 glucosylceramidase [Anaerocolumna xylanovorans DSM 12503]
MKIYTTNADVKFEERDGEFTYTPTKEFKLLKVYPREMRQEILGFGGAFTEASAYTWSKMSEENKDKLLTLYFGEDGNKYNFCRTHIQSCDFSLGNRAYVEENDTKLETFSIEGDFEYQIPFIKEALKRNKDIELLASPWSPPGFMKTNNEMNNGGKLKEEYYDAWAEIFVKYLKAYEKEGIVIKRVTIQNEPNAVQTWDSCQFTGEDERRFACEHLKGKLEAAGLLDVKISCWDHNKDLIVERCEEVFADEKALKDISGVAFHWYTGDHFEALQCIRDKYPGKELIFTEGCVEYSRFATANQTQNAEMYAHDIIGNLNSGMNGYIDWNLILDEKGGPNHVGNFCDAPVMCDTTQDTVDVKLSYYYIGHFSRFIKAGAKRVLVSRYTDKLDCCGFLNPDGGMVLVALNKTNEEQNFEIMMDGKSCPVEIGAHSIITACWKD